MHEFLEQTLYLGWENPTEKTTVYVRISTKQSLHTRGHITTFCCTFLQV